MIFMEYNLCHLVRHKILNKIDIKNNKEDRINGTRRAFGDVGELVRSGNRQKSAYQD